MHTTRRQFLAILAAVGGGIGLVGSACGDDDATPAPGRDGSVSCTTVQATIAANHGHTLTVDRSHVVAGTPRTYDITGSADHGHTVSLTAAHFATLAGGGSITVTSTASGHTHSVTVSCT